MSSLDAAAWTPVVLAKLYRLQGRVELVLKELRQDLNLDRLPSKDAHASQNFASVPGYALAVSRTVIACLAALADLVNLNRQIRPKPLTRTLRGAIQLLGAVLHAFRATSHVLLSLFVLGLLLEVRSTDTNRRDSFAGLKSLLG